MRPQVGDGDPGAGGDPGAPTEAERPSVPDGLGDFGDGQNAASPPKPASRPGFNANSSPTSGETLKLVYLAQPWFSIRKRRYSMAEGCITIKRKKVPQTLTLLCLQRSLNNSFLRDRVPHLGSNNKCVLFFSPRTSGS